ncbi:IS200/IS605 family transposase [Aggregatibacter kilianii]|uniref:IS200/IS605 family transposase n=1 Tax=Aggregatibacter kilianii TaxID=2025884 RepID=UPI000D6528B8|nr:IS200/IS605 family transposase [Aggregatibacter kilianii]
MSYTNLLYHIIFRTKYGLPTINEENEQVLYRYIWGFVEAHDSVLYRINGMPDHLHLFIELHQTISVAEFVRKLKKATHLFLDENKDLFPEFTEWSVGYCALSYCERDKQKIINYIKNQKTHHKHCDFTNEIKNLFQEEGINFNQEYFDQSL